MHRFSSEGRDAHRGEPIGPRAASSGPTGSRAHSGPRPPEVEWQTPDEQQQAYYLHWQLAQAWGAGYAAALEVMGVWPHNMCVVPPVLPMAQQRQIAMTDFQIGQMARCEARRDLAIQTMGWAMEVAVRRSKEEELPEARLCVAGLESLHGDLRHAARSKCTASLAKVAAKIQQQVTGIRDQEIRRSVQRVARDLVALCCWSTAIPDGHDQNSRKHAFLSAAKMAYEVDDHVFAELRSQLFIAFHKLIGMSEETWKSNIQKKGSRRRPPRDRRGMQAHASSEDDATPQPSSTAESSDRVLIPAAATLPTTRWQRKSS